MSTKSRLSCRPHLTRGPRVLADSTQVLLRESLPVAFRLNPTKLPLVRLLNAAEHLRRPWVLGTFLRQQLHTDALLCFRRCGDSTWRPSSWLQSCHGAIAINSSIAALPSSISVWPNLHHVACSCPSSLPSTSAVYLTAFCRYQHSGVLPTPRFKRRPS